MRMPAPIVTSRRHAWKGIVVELYRARDLDLFATPSEHVVVLQLHARNGHRGDAHYRSSVEPPRGNITITPAGARAQWRYPGETELQVMRVAPSVVEGVASEDNLDGAVCLDAHTDVSDAQIEYLGARLLDEMQGPARASRACVDGLVKLLAIHLLRHYSTARELPEAMWGKLPAYKLRQAIDYIDRNLANDLSLETIAQTLCMSAWHFAHLFKQTTGLAPHRYIIECRMQQAKSLLCETTLPVNEVGPLVGYANPSHFSTQFRLFTGQSPLRFRQRHA